MIMILYNYDLDYTCKSYNINDVSLIDFVCSLDEISVPDIVIYIDIRINAMRVLKHRYSSEYYDNIYRGIEIIEIVSKLLQLNNVKN